MHSWVLPGHAREPNFRRFVHCPQGVHAKCGQIWTQLPSYGAQVIEQAQSGHQTCFFHRLVAFGRKPSLWGTSRKSIATGAASHKMARVVILNTGCLKSTALFKSNQKPGLAIRNYMKPAANPQEARQTNVFFRSQLQGENKTLLLFVPAMDLPTAQDSHTALKAPQDYPAKVSAEPRP